MSAVYDAILGIKIILKHSTLKFILSLICKTCIGVKGKNHISNTACDQYFNIIHRIQIKLKDLRNLMKRTKPMNLNSCLDSCYDRVIMFYESL